MEKTIEHLVEITAEQSKNIDKMTEVIGELSREVQQKPSKRKALAYALAAGLVSLIAMLIVIVPIYQIVNTSQSISKTNKATLQTTTSELQLIQDCLNPEGQCKQDSDARTANAVQALICNQEKIAYVTVSGYNPLPQCDVYIEQVTGHPVSR